MILRASKKYVKQIAELHYLYLESILRDFGSRMCRVFYAEAIRSNDNFGYVYIEATKVLGYVFGTLDNSKLFNNPRIYAELFLALCRRPYHVNKLLHHLTNKCPTAPELSYIVVDPHFRRRGIGEKLLGKQHEEFKKRGLSYYVVRIDANNQASLALHQKFGARVKGQFLENGITRLILETKL